MRGFIKKKEEMMRVFLGLFCLSFLGPATWSHHREGKSPKEAFIKKNINIDFKIEDLRFSFQEIPAGSFIMGSPLDEKGRDEDEGQVKVTINKPFEIMTTEVTQAQYFLVTGKTPSYFSRQEDCKNWDWLRKICPLHPVESVSWHDVQDFIKKLNASAGIRGCEGVPEDPKGCYRLPTEAEWEWAVRAGTETAYFFGDDPSQLSVYAVYGGSIINGTHEVTTRWHNPNKLHGIYGNVWEWVQDAYSEELPGGIDPLVTDESKNESNRVLRGGSWRYGGEGAEKLFRSANRSGGYSYKEDISIGFRLVRTL